MNSFSEENRSEIQRIIKELDELNIVPGPINQKYLRYKAELLIDDESKELELVRLLVESHVPSLRLTARIVLESSEVEETEDLVLNKEHLSFSDTQYALSYNQEDLNLLLEHINEMPKEWTIVQVTPKFSSEEVFAIDSDQMTTNGFHIAFFNCGQTNEEPFSIAISKQSELRMSNEMRNIKEALKKVFTSPLQEGGKMPFSAREKRNYYKKVESLENDLKGIVRDLDEYWLGPWKCLFIGKYIDNTLEDRLCKLIDQFLTEQSLNKVSKKVKRILVQAVKGGSSTSMHMKQKYDEIILKYCFPDKQLIDVWAKFWNKNNILDGTEERLPVILIIDETLDILPWEMISTLKFQPASRMPSLHLLYAVYKVHQESIVDGFKLIPNFKNGKYIVNPGSDLTQMETRMKTFLQYWLPDWTGITNRAPTCNEFKDILTTANIFSYSGHGSGAQYCRSGNIKNKKLDSVVFLFGCGSTQLIDFGPEVEMYWTSQMYLLAACSCLIGMLWVVTDIDTDMLTTNFLSYWVPNSKITHWQMVNHQEWVQNGTIKIDDNSSIENVTWEPNLLKALSMAKSKMKYKCNQAAVVVRGIPLKLNEC